MMVDHFTGPSIWYLLCNYFFDLSTFIQKSVKNAEIRSFIQTLYGNLHNETNVLFSKIWKSEKNNTFILLLCVFLTLPSEFLHFIPRFPSGKYMLFSRSHIHFNDYATIIHITRCFPL